MNSFNEITGENVTIHNSQSSLLLVQEKNALQTLFELE